MRFVVVILLLFALHAVILFLMGQPLMYEGGLKLWHGIVTDNQNSQHLTDWYTFSHVIHGILFYFLFSLLFPRVPVRYRLLMSVAFEVGWELIENSAWIIDRYREQALAQGYFGDSVINSLGDGFAALVGYLIAWRIPVWGSVIAIIVLEGIALYAIRDSLTFNVIQLIHPIDAIGAWQAGN